MSTVFVVQCVAKAYRVPFFDGLHAALADEGVRIQIAYSPSPPSELGRADDVLLDPAYGVHVPGRWMFGERLLYQPVLKRASDADLVIVEQGNKQLANLLPLLAHARMGRGKIAFWGQGRNLHGSSRSLAEWIKARMVTMVDWWFAYTKGVADYVTSRGVRPEIVTVVQNAIDTRHFRDQLLGVTEADLADARRKLGIADTDPVGLFCGSLSHGKKLDFLIDSASRVKSELPRFHLLIVGAGPAQRELVAHATGKEWIHFLGRQDGAARAAYFRMAQAFLIPAWVGLSVVDAFAAGLPVITTDLPQSHSVEIEYIEPGQNGLITAHHPGQYAAAIAGLLRDRDLHGKLAEGARRAGDYYTIETMVENFAEGVLRCLRRPAGGFHR